MSKVTLPQIATGQANYATSNPVSGVGRVAGIIVPTHSSGTVKLVDSPNGPAGRVLFDTFTLPTGAQVINFNSPIEFYEGVHVIIAGTSATIQLMIEQMS